MMGKVVGCQRNLVSDLYHGIDFTLVGQLLDMVTKKSSIRKHLHYGTRNGLFVATLRKGNQ